MSARAFQAQSQGGAKVCKELKAHYAKVYNFPNKLENLRLKIAALRDEARVLGYEQEAAHLAALAVFAECLPKQSPRQADWTGQEIATLKRLWLEGVSAKNIATELGRTEMAVRASVQRFGLPKRKLWRRAA